MPSLVIKPRSRIFHGHDWVYASEIVKAYGDPQPGAVVGLKDTKNRTLGTAIFNPNSQIVARRFCRHRQDLDRDFFERRIGQAIRLREAQGLGETCRLVWSESDALPGLIVDRYGDCLVVQTLTVAFDQRLPLIVEALLNVVKPRVIVERNDAPIRVAEGLPSRTGLLHGELDGPIEVTIHGVKFEIDLLRGHKTGFYLDQVGNYLSVAQLAKGRRVLDCFANQGAFALFAAQAGATEVKAVESSAEAVDAAKKNAARNGLRLEAIEANVFDFLNSEERRNAEYDLIVLDPPSFTKSKGKLGDALRGYKEIHLRAFKLLRPGGILATYCCSHHVTDAVFLDVIREALNDAKVSARILGRQYQGPDHPVLALIPETEYLKGYLLEMTPPR